MEKQTGKEGAKKQISQVTRERLIRLYEEYEQDFDKAKIEIQLLTKDSCAEAAKPKSAS